MATEERSYAGSRGRPEARGRARRTACTRSAGERQEDGKLKVGELELSDDIAALMATKAQADLRATQVPANAADYKPDLPADLKLPPGIEFKIDVSDPSYKDLANFAHARGWSQSDLSTALGIFASREAREAAAFAAGATCGSRRNSAPMAHRA